MGKLVYRRADGEIVDARGKVTGTYKALEIEFEAENLPDATLDHQKLPKIEVPRRSRVTRRG